MEKKSKKSVVIGITILFLVTLILLGLTYAYYRTRIVGNEEEKSISVTSKKLEVTYSDDKAVIEAEGIEPGYTATKTFSVENTGSEPTNFGIVLDNVENTFTRKSDWTFVLKQGETVIREGVVPSHTSYILNTKSIAADETIEYTLTINYANLTDVNQSEDMGKSLIIRVNIANETGAILESAEDGTLLAAIRDNNLISEPLTPAGKSASGVKTFAEETFNETGKTINVSDSMKDYFIVYATGYEFDTTTGVYNLTGVTYAKYNEVYNQLGGKYTFNATTSVLRSAEPNEEFLNNATQGRGGIFKISENPAPSLTGFSVNSKSSYDLLVDEAELSETEDDYGTSYYYRGLVNNNYVNFSGMCWRIVRVQGDGTTKLILADDDRLCNDEGFEADYEGGYLDNGQKFRYSAASLTGLQVFDYETSNVKKVLDAWLNDTTVTLEDGYTKTFSNSIDTTNLTATDWCSDTTQSKVTASITYFGANDRLGSSNKKNVNPTLKCDFTGINNTETTVVENQMIGILTGDELAFSGHIGVGINLNYDLDYPNGLWENYILHNGQSFWTMTPFNYWSGGTTVYAQLVSSFDGLYNHDISYATDCIRPVIVLKADAKITSGNGTKTSPYVISSPYNAS